MASGSRVPPGLGAGTASTTIYLKMEGLANASVNSIFGGVGKVYIVKIDATSNTGQDVYVKGYDSAAPTVGSEAADLVLIGKRGVVTEYTFPRGIAFATDISMACVQEAGGLAGTTSPSGTVDVEVQMGD
jgi:hypothetical protein